MTIPTTTTSIDKPTNSVHILKSILAGGISGCVAKTVTAPLDRVKILFQGYNPHYVHHSGRPFGVFKAARSIFDSHGISGLFQGHSVMLLRIFPSAGIRFMAYEQFKRILIPTPEQKSAFRHFLAGSLAGNCAVLATYPLEVIRSRLAYEIRSSSQQQYIQNTIRTIYTENGNSIRGFYKGFTATMYGVIPYAGSAFMSYQYLKDACLNQWSSWALQTPDSPSEKPQLKVGVHLLIGGMAGMLGQTVAYPFDTVRHRMQLYGVATGIPHYSSVAHALRTIFTKEGWRAIYVGLTINYWKTMPANAVAFVVYDKMKHLLDI